MIPEYTRMDRRESLKWLAAAAATIPALRALGATPAPIAQAAGTLSDPELLQPKTEWGRTLTTDELRTLVALCDQIIPADYQAAGGFDRAMPPIVGTWAHARPAKNTASPSAEFQQGIAWLDGFAQSRLQRNYFELPEDLQSKLFEQISPSASQVKVPDFIDEWVSAPYPAHQVDKALIQEGLAWINRESRLRFTKSFAEASEAQRKKICDDICFPPPAKPEHQKAATFFSRVRDLTAGGFFTTKIGMKDLRYVGNVALQTFKGPPPEVLLYLKLA